MEFLKNNTFIFTWIGIGVTVVVVIYRLIIRPTLVSIQKRGGVLQLMRLMIWFSGFCSAALVFILFYRSNPVAEHIRYSVLVIVLIWNMINIFNLDPDIINDNNRNLYENSVARSILVLTLFSLFLLSTFLWP